MFIDDFQSVLGLTHYELIDVKVEGFYIYVSKIYNLVSLKNVLKITKSLFMFDNT